MATNEIKWYDAININEDYQGLDYELEWDYMNFIELASDECDVILFATLDLWNGVKETAQYKFNSIADAVKRIVYANFDNQISITQYGNEKIEVVQVHHDGTNVFTIKALSEYGVTQFDENGKVDLDDKKCFTDIVIED
jgi:hypothetical protein